LAAKSSGANPGDFEWNTKPVGNHGRQHVDGIVVGDGDQHVDFFALASRQQSMLMADP
jgi:hypothetical protein